jgi:hypothetical protein
MHKTDVPVAYITKISIGYGEGKIATNGDVIVINLATILQIPNEVAFNRVGKSSFMMT